MENKFKNKPPFKRKYKCIEPKHGGACACHGCNW